MIKINLSPSTKQLDISNLGGLDFSKIKIKALLIVIALFYVPNFFLYPMWATDLEVKNAELQTQQSALNRIKRKVSQNQNFEKQIRELKAQEENFKKKLLAVKEAINEKRNPSTLLQYISKNIPKELWITDLVIDSNSMTIRGEALDYISIGNFVTSLRSSVFIKDANIVNTQSAVRDTDKRRIESFEVKFVINRLDQ
jgi:type IV pilus assembly protein PilN